MKKLAEQFHDKEDNNKDQNETEESAESKRLSWTKSQPPPGNTITPEKQGK